MYILASAPGGGGGNLALTPPALPGYTLPHEATPPWVDSPCRLRCRPHRPRADAHRADAGVPARPDGPAGPPEEPAALHLRLLARRTVLPHRPLRASQERCHPDQPARR